MPPLSVLIKPVSGRCDLRCKYCFYRDETEKRSVADYGVMSEAALERVVQRLFSEATDSCSFAFQGGEPTLAGLGFYRRLIELQAKYNVKHCTVHNAIQTNGMQINEEWAAFFAENSFLVGLSLDGTPELHNKNRRDAGGGDTASRVLRSARLLKKYRVPFNILCVVTAAAAKHAQQLYLFMKKQGFAYMQFIPCLDPYGEERGKRDYSLTPELYGRFLKTIFDLWYGDIRKGTPVSIRSFDNLVGMAAGQRPEACGMLGICQCQYIIEADGSVYPCDFYVFDEYRLGNVFNDTFSEMFKSAAAKKFIEASFTAVPECKDCRWYALCRGGCRRDRDYGGELGRNYFCDAYKDFFAYATPRIIELAARFR